MDAYSYLRWIFNKWRVEFYRVRTGTFYFRVDLPFIHITNTFYSDVVSTGTDSQYRKVPKISWKVFGWKIKISE